MALPLLPLAMMAGSALAGYASSRAAKSGKMKQNPLRSPEQMQRINQVGQQGMQMLQNPYAGFEPIAQNAINQYQTQVVPSLAERFTSMGKNLPTSGAFTSQLNQSGDQLQKALAAMQAQYGQQQQQNALGLLNFGNQPQFENIYQPAEHTPLSGVLAGISAGAGALGMQGLENYFMSPGAAKQPQSAAQTEQELRSAPIMNPAPMEGTPEMARANLKPALAQQIGAMGQPFQSAGAASMENLLRSLGSYQSFGQNRSAQQLREQLGSVMQNYNTHPEVQQMMQMYGQSPQQYLMY